MSRVGDKPQLSDLNSTHHPPPPPVQPPLPLLGVGGLRLAARRRRTVLHGDPTPITALRKQSGLPHFARWFPPPGNLVSTFRVPADARRGHYFAKARVATPAVRRAAYIVLCKDLDLEL